jgi:23S rRNA pseudouridine1911/1915/1917 synthase
MSLAILYEDNHLLAVDKPAGLATMGAAEGEASLVTVARHYLKERYHKPGNVYIGVVSRLDALATGVVVLAKTSKGAARLSEQFRAGRVEKTYRAAVEGTVEPPSGECRGWISKDDRRQRMFVHDQPHPGGQEAILAYRTRQRLREITLLEVQLETGRKHQIRVQLAALGHPILGDRKYGGKMPFPAGIALHAWKLRLEHPTKKTPLELEAPLPATWSGLPATDTAR